MTGLEFDALPYEEGRLLELLDGELIRMPSPTLEHQQIVFRVLKAIDEHLTDRSAKGAVRATTSERNTSDRPVAWARPVLRVFLRGAVVSHDVEFALSRDTRLRPDVWAVLAPRATEVNPSVVPIPGGPDLAIEIISPSEYASESMRKVAFYLDHGVQEVWQVYPKTKEVVIYSPQGQVRKCRLNETLASWLLVDFRIPISRFFS